MTGHRYLAILMSPEALNPRQLLDSAKRWVPHGLGAMARDLRFKPVEGHEAVQTVERIHRLINGGRLPLRLWDGQTLGPETADFRLALSSPQAVRALLPPSDLTAGQAYIDGRIDIEGDAVAALTTAGDMAAAGDIDAATIAQVLAHLARLPPLDGEVTDPGARLSGKPHSLARDRAAIQFHYDVGNDFFGLFLDDDLVYSCAYYLNGDETLEAAQRRKLDVVCRKLGLGAGDRFLDVGCGWGSLAIHAATHYEAQVVGVTLSQEQAKLGAERVAEAGLTHRVDIRLQDYREVTGPFDAIASVGMFEHVGPDNLGSYFATLAGLVTDTGRILNHGITTGQRMAVADYASGPPTFASAYVFPDGGLVPAWRAVREMESAGLELRDVEQLRPSYALTLRAWLGRLEDRWEEAVEIAGERTARIWRVYLAGSAAGFERGDLGVVQVLGTTPGAYGPLGRRWMGPAE